MRVHISSRSGALSQPAMLRACRPLARGVRLALPRSGRQVQAQAAAVEYPDVQVVEQLEAATFRELPINYAPPTEYTVDNVAAEDAQRFQLHSSVDFWQNFTTRLNTRSIQNSEEQAQRSQQRAEELASVIRDMLATSALEDAESAAYWAYHLGRTGFFIGTGALGATAHHLYTQLTSRGTGEVRTPLQNLASNVTAEVQNRLYEGIAMYRQDLASIKGGAYKLPWDMTTLTHRQYNPLFMLNRGVRFVAEATATLNRRMANSSTANWFSSNMYPAYFMDNTFHYQTDGWLSSRSADVYEFSTETLFFGRQDSMQRSALLPLHQFILDNGLDPSRLKLLELGCGTGRFHTFLKDNYPTMPTVASDLSPYYLAKARDNALYWKSQRAADKQLGGYQDTGVEFMQCAAESIPASDNSFDIVVSVYMTHEMPEEARAGMAREAARVLRPGGLFVLTDSVQLGDRPEWDPTLGAFGSFNEPHYRNFIACNFGAMFEDAGLQPAIKYLASATKTLSFVKKAVSAPPSSNSMDGATMDPSLFAGSPGLN